MTGASSAGSGLQAQRLDPTTLDADERTAWAALADRAAEPNPFMRPEFVVANVIERRSPVELLVVRDATRWLACVPVRHRAPSMRLPVPSLEVLTDEYALCGTPLLDGDALERAAEALIDVVRAERRAAALTIAMFPSDGPVGAALAAAAAKRGLRPIVVSEYERAAWRRSADQHFPGPAFNRSDRRELARRGRLLALDLGGPLEVVDRSDEPDAWETFLAMEASGWKADRGTALGSTPADTAFFRRMCAGMSAAGRLEVVALEGAGRTVAMECHLLDGGVHYSFKIAHDPDYRRFSPGTQLKYRVIERFQDQGLTLADSCANPQNAHMNRLWPDRRRMQTLLLPTGAIGARAVRPAIWARSMARSVRDARSARPRPPAASPADESPTA